MADGTGLQDFRAQYPQYNDLSDTQLADKLYSRYYSDMPRQTFNRKMGYDPQVAQMGSAERFARGFGHQVAEWGRGAEQLAVSGTRATLLPSERDKAAPLTARSQELSQQETESRRANAPLMRTTGAKVGSMAAEALPFLAGPEGWAATAGIGAAEGALEPTAGEESRTLNTALGAGAGVAGRAVGSLAGRAIQPFRNTLEGARDAAVDVLRRAGVPLDAEQQIGGRVLRTAKNAAADNPVFGPSEFPARQQEAFTRAVLREMGIANETEASPAVMQAGRQQLRNAYNAIAARNHINVDAVMDRDLQAIQTQAEQSLNRDDANVIRAQIRNIYDGVRTGPNPGQGTILGDRYAAINQALDRVPGQGGKAPFVTDIRQALTAALRRSASPQDIQLLAQTDQRYGAMRQIERAIGPDNQISPALLYNATDTLARTNQSIYGQGANQRLVELAQAGRLVFGSRTPNSGTPQRVAGMALFGAGGAYADRRARGAGSVEPWLVGLASSVAGPAAVRAVIENPTTANALRQWATNQGITNAATAARYLGRIGGASTAESAIQRRDIPLSDMQSQLQ